MEDGNYDVVIVGGGPAGSTCAAFLGKMGHKVLLLDKQKFPRDKTCGDAISGKARGVMKDLGITDIVEQNPHAKVFGVAFSSPDGTLVRIPIPQDRGLDYGYCARREVFDNLLFDYARKFATVMEEFEVTEVLKEGDKVVGVKGVDKKTKQEMTFNAKITVGADGATSIVARKLGLGTIEPQHHCAAIRAYYKGVKDVDKYIELHFVKSLIPGYLWIFPLEDGLANVGVGMLTSDMQKKHVNLKDEMEKIIRENPMFKERFANAELVGNIKGWNLPLGSTHRKAHGDGFILLGDAASLIDPFTGEGIGNAMLSGKVASGIIHKALSANDFSAQVLGEYETNLWQLLESELKNSYGMQKLGKHEWLLNLIMRKAARNEWIRKELSGTLIDQHARKSLTSVAFYLKILFAQPLF